MVHWIEHWAGQRPNEPALHGKRDGGWTSLTWQEYWASVRAAGQGLIALGHQVGDGVAIVGRNRPEWVQLQFGIQAARGAPAPIYATNTREQLGWIVANSGARIAICDDVEQLRKILDAEAQGAFGRLERIVTFDPLDHDDERLLSFAELQALGRQQDAGDLDARLADLTDDETCLLIYTSGTTGTPKGVELDHKAQMLMGQALLKHFPEFREPGSYILVSYLPLCHVAEQLFTNMCALPCAGEVYFCPDITELRDALAEVRPTCFLGVPRVWEKFEAALRARLGQATGLRARLASWAMATELSAFRTQVERGAESYMPLSRRIARGLVIDKIKGALGLDRLRLAATGAAPIGVETQEFFASIGVTVLEGYGMSETCGAATIGDRYRPRFGTVGKPLDGVEVRIAEDGEVQLRGRTMTRGYLHLPDKTAELITDDGWLRTGDLGELDEEGNLRITGRKKEILITAGGKNVAPVEMENHIKAVPGVGQAVVVGDRKPYLSALVTLDPENLDELAEAAGSDARDLVSLAKDPKVRAYVQTRIEGDCNARVARYQTIKKFTILPTEFSVDGGELTPTMKLKRAVIADKYAGEIEGMYAERPVATPPAA